MAENKITYCEVNVTDDRCPSNDSVYHSLTDYWPRGYKKFNMLNSAEQEKKKTFLAYLSLEKSLISRYIFTDEHLKFHAEVS